MSKRRTLGKVVTSAEERFWIAWQKRKVVAEEPFVPDDETCRECDSYIAAAVAREVRRRDAAKKRGGYMTARITHNSVAQWNRRPTEDALRERLRRAMEALRNLLDTSAVMVPHEDQPTISVVKQYYDECYKVLAAEGGAEKEGA